MFEISVILKTFCITQMNAIWFDTFHAIANAIFLGAFGMKTITIFERYKKRFNWQYVRKEDV